MQSCTPNIGPRQRRRRLRLGAIGFAAAVALGTVLAVAGAPAPLRTLIFIPLAGAAYGFYQYREKT